MRPALSGLSVALLSLSLVVLVPFGASAASGWGGGVSVPGWGAFNWGGGGGQSGWGNGSGYYAYPYTTDYNYYGYPSTVATQLAHITNPATNGVNLTFWVNNQQFVLPPGAQQDVSFVPGQTILFDRGAGRGTAQYSLDSAMFTFSPTPAGWELYRTVLGTPAANIASGNPPATGVTPGGTQPTLPSASTAVPTQR